LVIFFIHLGNFIVGEIVEEWQWWLGRRGGRDRGLDTVGHQCRRMHAQLPAPSASMPAQELRRRTQWSATALTKNVAVG
jgi:hypothetical protein